MIEKRIQRNKLKVIAKYSHNGRGIVTGPHNPASVGCNMYVLEGGLSGTVFTLNRWHEGHNMLAHGGIIASILDEVLGYSNHTREYVLGLKYTPVFTGTVKYTYLKPVKVGERYFASAKITKIEGRKRFVEGEIYDDDGLFYATGEGVFLTSDELSDDEEIVKYTELTKDDPVEI